MVKCAGLSSVNKDRKTIFNAVFCTLDNVIKTGLFHYRVK